VCEREKERKRKRERERVYVPLTKREILLKKGPPKKKKVTGKITAIEVTH